MPDRVLTDAGIWISGYDLAGVSNSVTLNASVNLLDRSTFADEGWTKRAAGLKTSSFALSGFFDTDGPDEEQFNSLGAERSVLVVPAEMTPGAVAWVVPVAVSAHETAGSIGELIAFSYAAEGDGKPSRAQVVEIRENVRNNHTSAQVQLGAILAGQRMRVFIHATEVTNGDLDINIRSGSQGGVTTSRAFRNNWNSTGMFELTIDGPITHDWWDVHYTGVSGAFDMAVVAAIE